MDKDAFYFPHFCNARHDRKIKRVRKELGLEGYGIFFMLLEVLREQPEYKYPVADIDLLADEFGTSEQKIKTVIGNYDLFQHDNEYFTHVLYNKYSKGNKRKRLYEVNVKEWYKIIRIVFKRDNYTCAYCNAVGGKLEVDHIIPFSKGGGDNLDNLTTACRKCNRQKKDKTVDEFYRWRESKG